MRRAQGTSQVIVFILALLIGSLVLIFGYTSLQKIRNAALETEKAKFQSGLESTLKGLSYGSTRKKSLAVPGGYLAICFADLHYLRGQVPPDGGTGAELLYTSPTYRLVNDSIFSGVESNVFIMPDGIWSFSVGDLEIYDANLETNVGFGCFNLSGGRVEVGFEGLGNRTKVYLQ